jgi:hypothetical protein
VGKLLTSFFPTQFTADAIAHLLHHDKAGKKIGEALEGDDWDMYSGYILELMMVVPFLFPFSGSRPYGLQFNTSG